MRTLFAVLYIAGAIPAAIFIGRCLRWVDDDILQNTDPLAKPSRMPQERRKVWGWRAIGAAIVLSLSVAALAACHGGEGSSPAADPAKVSTPTDPPTVTTTATCPAGDTGTYPDCEAPTPAPLPSCGTGTTALYLTVCQCPAADVNGSSCIVPVSPPPNTPPPVTVLPACPQGTTSAPLNCACPAVDLDSESGSCVIPIPPVATLPPCSVGTTQPYATVCSCPTNYVQGTSCTVPSSTPAATMTLTYCPSVDYTAAGNVCTAPGATLESGQSAVLLWTSTNATGCYGASGWPTSDELTPSGFVTTPALTQSTAYSLVCQGGGGNATASVTVQVASSVTTPSNPTSPSNPTPPPVAPVLTETLTISPATVVNDSNGCPDPAGNPCVATVAIDTASTLAGDSILCYVPPAAPSQYLVGSLGLGPYPASQDGPQVITVNCYDVWDATSTASITLNVVPPAAPLAPVFTGVSNGDGTWTFTWDTPVSGPTCYVEEFSNGGPWSAGVTLIPGGTTSGTAASPVMLPSYSPYTFTLYCAGVPLPGTPSITVSL